GNQDVWADKVSATVVPDVALGEGVQADPGERVEVKTAADPLAGFAIVTAMYAPVALSPLPTPSAVGEVPGDAEVAQGNVAAGRVQPPPDAIAAVAAIRSNEW